MAESCSVYTPQEKKSQNIPFVYHFAKIINLLPSPNYPTFSDQKRKKTSDQHLQEFAICIGFTSLQWL